MDRFELGLDLAGAAFQDGESSEIARILRVVAAKIEANGVVDFGDPSPIYDVNGNRVGEWFAR